MPPQNLWPTTDDCAWGARGTQGERAGGFIRRYLEPLVVMATIQLHLDPEEARDTVQDFCVRVLFAQEAGRRVFASYSSDKGRFRSYLWVCFKSFCNERRRGRASTILSIDAVESEPPHLADELAALAARDWLNGLREDLHRETSSAVERAYVDRRWPAELAMQPAPDTAIAMELGLSLEQMRAAKKRVVERFCRQLDSRLHREGYPADEAQEIIKDAAHALFTRTARP